MRNTTVPAGSLEGRSRTRCIGAIWLREKGQLATPRLNYYTILKDAKLTFRLPFKPQYPPYTGFLQQAARAAGHPTRTITTQTGGRGQWRSPPSSFALPALWNVPNSLIPYIGQTFLQPTEPYRNNDDAPTSARMFYPSSCRTERAGRHNFGGRPRCSKPGSLGHSHFLQRAVEIACGPRRGRPGVRRLGPVVWG